MHQLLRGNVWRLGGLSAWVVAGVGLAMLARNAWAEDILAVLDRSQGLQLQALTAESTSPERVAVVQAAFNQLLAVLHPTEPVELRVVHGAVVAETLSGHIVVANESLAEMPQGQRLFILAHELGHVRLHHWAQVQALYQRLIPGEVVREKTDAVGAELGREASQLAHQQEFEADAAGYKTVASMGYDLDTVQGLFMQAGMQRDTATHPSSWRRLAQLRALAADAAPQVATQGASAASGPSGPSDTAGPSAPGGGPVAALH
jgi:Zn-dependent protease with chaperone function